MLFGVLFTFIASEKYTADQQLDFAMKLLDEGRWDVADRIARDIETDKELTPAREPVWNYVRGVAGALATADKLERPQARQTLARAAEFLIKSRDAGYPIGYRGKGAYWLGYCYFQTYDWQPAIDALSPVVDSWSERRSDALDMMVEACLRQHPPDRAQAEKLLQRWSKIPGITTGERHQISLRRANLAFVDGDWKACENALLSIPPDVPQASWAKLARGRWKLENSKQLEESDPERRALTEQALGEFRQVFVAPGTPPTARRQASFLIGVTLRTLGRNEEAISTLSACRQRSPESAEAVASGIEEAEIQTEAGEFNDALETARHVIIDLGDKSLYDERWMPLPVLEKRLLDLGANMRAAGSYPQAIRLAGYLPPVFKQSGAVRLEAETYKHWAERLEETPITTQKQRDELRRDIDTKYTLAGDKFKQLAKLESITAAFPTILWEAIESYRKAHQLVRANELLIEYLQHEERSKRPRALLALGRNYLNAGDWDKTLPPLERCLSEFPDHPNCYEARLIMAQALSEKQKLEDASEMLLKNLYDGNLQPDSKLWGDSLFELGRIIFKRGDLLQLEVENDANGTAEQKLEKLKASHEEMLVAINRLAEAVERFRNDPRSLEARYAIGRAYRTAAKFPEQLVNSGQITIESTRRQLNQERRQLLNASLDGYRDLKRALGDAQERAVLSEGNQSLLRNCFFGEADVLFELGNYEEAIAAYRNIPNRFMNQPEALEAYMQIAQCYKLLGQPNKARNTLIQAETLLSRIPPELDGRFKLLTRADRQGWAETLAFWLKQI
ncbi:MAG: tetratricopeptide repeat protein [Pirellulales bacterium]